MVRWKVWSGWCFCWSCRWYRCESNSSLESLSACRGNLAVKVGRTEGIVVYANIHRSCINHVSLTCRFKPHQNTDDSISVAFTICAARCCGHLEVKFIWWPSHPYWTNSGPWRSRKSHDLQRVGIHNIDCHTVDIIGDAEWLSCLPTTSGKMPHTMSCPSPKCPRRSPPIWSPDAASSPTGYDPSVLFAMAQWVCGGVLNHALHHLGGDHGSAARSASEWWTSPTETYPRRRTGTRYLSHFHFMHRVLALPVSWTNLTSLTRTLTQVHGSSCGVLNHLANDSMMVVQCIAEKVVLLYMLIVAVAYFIDENEDGILK